MCENKHFEQKLACAHVVYITTELNFIILAYKYIASYVNSYPCPVYQILNVNWSAFLKSILPILTSHDCNNGTNGGH